MKNAIFIPCYNCQKQLTRVCAKIQKHKTALKSNSWDNIYLIDNQSNDETFNVAKASQKILQSQGFNAYTVKNTQNYGLGGTHKVAFTITLKEEYDYCCIMHGDDQAEPSDLTNISNTFLDYDAMLGSRFSRKSKLFGYSKTRIAGNLFINAVYTLVIGKRIKDLGSGLNIFSNKIASDDKINQFADGMHFNTSLLMLIVENYKYRFFPITWRESDQDSNAKNLDVAKSILKNLYSTKFLKNSYGLKKYEDIASYKFEVN